MKFTSLAARGVLPLPTRTSRFNSTIIQDALASDPRYARLASACAHSYAEFCASVAPHHAPDLEQRVLDRLADVGLAGTTLYTTSGSRGTPTPLLRITALEPGNAGPSVLGTRGSYGRALADQLQEHVIAPTDRVLNLFTAGAFSNLYDGCNRVLSLIGANILPVGRLDAYGTDLPAVLALIRRAMPNVVLGTPTSVMHCLRTLDAHGIRPPLAKVIYTGEAWTAPKRAFIQSLWPNMRLFGLYGATEAGFMGLHTPQCDIDCYHVFDDWSFFEELTACSNSGHFPPRVREALPGPDGTGTIHDGSLLVTSRANPGLPLLRYSIGDRGRVGPAMRCGCGMGGSVLQLLGRADHQFKYAGNLVSADVLASRLRAHLGQANDLQFQLATDAQGRDRLVVAFDLDAGALASVANQVKQTLLEIEDIRECVEKDMGWIDVRGREAMRQSLRQKTPILIDERNPGAPDRLCR